MINLKANFIDRGKFTKFIQSFATVFIFTLITGNLFAQSVSIVEAFPNLTFIEPLFLTHSPDSTNRIFVLERSGRILVFPNNDSVSTYEVFLDIQDRVQQWSGSELGLFSIAFHPNYSDNDRFYVVYSVLLDTLFGVVVSQFSVNPDNPNEATPESELILLTIPNTSRIHFGGMSQFATDGYLYISKGDGGTNNEPPWIYTGIVSEAQNLNNLLGTILRIDVDNPSNGLNYGIPPDNPFVGNTDGYREEIWAWGLRNPWRFSIDKITGELWVGDVGQFLYEEIDIIEKGRNYGWNVMEGYHCFADSTCDTTGFEPPIFEYSHDFGCSIIGGYIYHGSKLPDLLGAYIYADYCSGLIWMLKREEGQIVANSLLISSDLNISSFGIDEEMELYVTDLHESGIYRLVAGNVGITDEVPNVPAEFRLFQNYPNPFNPWTTISYSIPRSEEVTLIIYNLLGKEITRLVDGASTRGQLLHHLGCLKRLQRHLLLPTPSRRFRPDEEDSFVEVRVYI